MTAVADLHTHRLDSTNGIISVNPFFNAYDAAKHYSAGIHPWNAESAAEREINALYEAAARGEVVAIGECGLDRLRGGCLDYQIKIFREHISLSEALRKPLIVHCVRCTAELLAERKRSRAAMPWAFHGFRGGAAEAAQLCRAGIYVSLGERFNAQAAAVVPEEMLLAETDESLLSLGAVTERIGQFSGADTARNLRQFLSIEKRWTGFNRG